MDLQRVINFLIANEYDIVDDAKDADYIILTSCGFIEETAMSTINDIIEYNKLKVKKRNDITWMCS